jgi:uncharacterized phage-associated protein
MSIRFAFNASKALEALAFIASARPGLTPLLVAKILFFADKWHINKYGRPIIADTYIAMERGPVPSTVKHFIDEKWDWVGRPDDFDEAITINSDKYMRRHLMPGRRGPDVLRLSATDVECLNKSISFCEGKTADELSDITHFEKSWRNTVINGEMNYEDFIDDNNENKEAILQEMEEFAACGVL